MDPRQVVRDSDGAMHCPECGFRYDLDPQEVVAQSRSGLQEVDEALRTVPEAYRRVRPSPDVWSVNAYVSHLTDTVDVISWRVRAISQEERPHLPNHDQDQAVEDSHADERPADRSLEQLTHGVDAFCRLIEGYDPATWQRVGVHSRAGEVRLADAAQDMPHELHHHARDIRQVGERVEAGAVG
jgi:hypothetical protein